MTNRRASAWKPTPPLPDDVRCDALLWYARHPERFGGDVRCNHVASYRVVGTDVIVCDLHAAPLRFGQTISTIHGPVSDVELEPLAPPPTRHRLKSARPQEIGVPPEPGADGSEIAIGATYANATRDAFPEGLPPRPITMDDRRWTVLRRRWEGDRLEAIATELRVTRSRAQQLEASALSMVMASVPDKVAEPAGETGGG